MSNNFRLPSVDRIEMAYLLFWMEKQIFKSADFSKVEKIISEISSKNNINEDKIEYERHYVKYIRKLGGL